MITILSVLGFISLSFAGCVFVTYFLLSGGLTFLSATSDKIKNKMSQQMQKQRSHVEDVSSSSSTPEHKQDYVFVQNGKVEQEVEPRQHVQEMISDAQKDG
jgi:hypothetical protein